MSGRRWTSRLPAGRREASLLAALVVWLGASPAALGQASYFENEPNDTPGEANEISGAVDVYGTMVGGDQDGFLWTVSDDDARKRWTFELVGIPGALTIAEVVKVRYTEDGTGVAGVDRLMKMGTRDGLTPSVHEDQLFEPGDYLIGIAHAGGPKEGGGAFRPPTASLSFGDDGNPDRVDGSSGSEAADATTDATESGAWRLFITESGPLNVLPNPGSRESRAQAGKLRPGGQFATFETRPSTWYRLDFTEKDADHRWDVEIRAPIGRMLNARLTDGDGSTLAEGRVDAHGRIRFPDLAPGVATWFLELSTEDPGFIHWVRVAAAGLRVEGEEREPNDKRDLANRVDFAQPVTGRIGGDDRYDYFTFEVGEADADELKTLVIESAEPGDLELCLYDDKWARLQCRSGTTPVSLPDLKLEPGHWGVVVDRAGEIEYTLSLDSQGPIRPGTEVEPNDSIEYASGVPANLRIKGRFHGDDTDFYQFLVADEPQLWRFQVIGDGIHEIGYADGSAHEQFSRRVAGTGQRRLRLDNVFLLPGRHYIRVQGRDSGSYTLLARPLGPPDPNGEIEPNDTSNMQRLAIGQTRTGLLVDTVDSDYYRFFLANWTHIRLTLQPPPDGQFDGYLYWYGAPLGKPGPHATGEPVSIEGLFPPGDYHFWLRATEPSDAEYRVSLEGLPRFSCPADCEPNGIGPIWLAAPLPADLVLEGRTDDWRDWDYYQLPAFDEATALLIRTPKPVRELDLGTHWGARERLDFDAELGGYRVTVPAGGSYRLMVAPGEAPYRLALEFPDGPLVPATGPLNVSLALALDDRAVSAFRQHGQRVRGSLTLTNGNTAGVQLGLEAATGDYRWSATVTPPKVSLAAGETASVPVEVVVPADAWGDRPVRISVAARDAAGRQVQTHADIGVDPDLPPVAPFQSWAIPEALRGGFNAAWLPFGGEWTGDSPEAVKARPYLRDGLVFPGIRIETGGDNDGWTEEEKPRWTLDLPGDEPLPVAGIAINHFGTPGPFVDIRKGTLLLSDDGTNFEEVLSFEALPVETEQHFALEHPLAARFARLRIDATFQEPSRQRVFASEWKVILEPGYDISGGAGFNIADPALGGHVVWDWPPRAYLPAAILEDQEGEHLERAITTNSRSANYIIGFLQNRAAQIESVDWRYPDDADEKWRTFERVDVSASMTSPVGPWVPLGAIDLSDGASTAKLKLEHPAWARYVRLSAYLQPEAGLAAAPAVVRIWERPTDPGYTSVLTEWGETGSRAFYELQSGLAPEPALEARGNETRATAAPLETGKAVRGYVSLGKQEHWYRVRVPQGHNLLTLTMQGDPTVRTVLDLEGGAGESMPVRRVDQRNIPGQHRFEAVVEPGSEVYVHVAEPPRNVVFSWDTSASVLPYIPLINNALVAFSSQVVPGREAVNLMPFPMGPLLKDWYGEPYVLQTTLNDYRRPSASSAAEYTLKRAAQVLAPRPGTKAIVVITDADTTHDGQMWGAMRQVQPRVFGIGVAGSSIGDQNRFRDWAGINGGTYNQLHYQGEMEVAFDRATALMRRPAGYTLLVESEFREAPGPGHLAVVAGGDRGDTATGPAVELILDASGSMLKRMDGKRRIAIAKEVLTEAVRKQIPAGTPVALRVFGHKEVDSCRTDLEIPLAPLDPEAAARTIANIQAMNLARTPIADSLKAVEGDLLGADSGAIVLVTDGEETCDGDPAAVLQSLADKGFAATLNIVGFAIDDPELAGRFRSWAALGGGRYFAANDEAGLSEAIADALRVSFTVYDGAGNEAAVGQVGGAPVELEQGTYRVIVHTRPERIFDEVEVLGESSAELELD